ncbi:MAG: hypothetical protein GAK40_00767 [Burkholderia plantarii]|nr:MAG: hypothetical protein GAK40_00767 [Burkholderia plantarii]
MSDRSPAVQTFIDAARTLFASERLSADAHRLADEIFARLDRAHACRYAPQPRFPACDALGAALQPQLDASGPFGDVARSIRELEPYIGWAQRTGQNNASANFLDGHANGMICGPGGIEHRLDLNLGFTIMTPDVRYPDHGHPPEEAYVLMTDGQFRKDRGPWIAPGIGAGIHNAPGAIHAVRSDDRPLLALWILKL